MAELIGRKAIAEHLGITGGELSRLIICAKRFQIPVRIKGRQLIAESSALDEWAARKLIESMPKKEA